jgi:hypothetical protein
MTSNNIYGCKSSAHYKASRLLKNSAHLDKCATAKTVHYFKNRDKIICNKHQSGVIEPVSPITWIGGKMVI